MCSLQPRKNQRWLAVTSAMPDSTLDLIASLAENAAGLMLGSYTQEDWQNCPEVDELRKVAMLLRDAGREVPPAVLNAIETAKANGR